MAFDWVPIKSIALWFTISEILYTWGSVLKTQLIHYNNGDVLRILEPLALFGIASSVNYQICKSEST